MERPVRRCVDKRKIRDGRDVWVRMSMEAAKEEVTTITRHKRAAHILKQRSSCMQLIFA